MSQKSDLRDLAIPLKTTAGRAFTEEELRAIGIDFSPSKECLEDIRRMQEAMVLAATNLPNIIVGAAA